jgi:hypothetical protein
MNREFYQITEHNDWEGETWKFYLVKDGNEKYIDKLKKAVEKFDEYGDVLEISETLVPEFEVDILVKHADSNYMMSHNKVDKVLDPKTLVTKNQEKFFDHINKGGSVGL